MRIVRPTPQPSRFLGPEQRRLPDDVGFRHAGRELALHRFGDDEADVVREAVIEPPAPVRNCGVGTTEGCPDPDLAVAQLDRAGRRVVRPQIECAAAVEIEAGVVPMAGQDAVLDAAAVEREAHVRASVVEREDAAAVIDDEDRPMGAVQTSRPFAFRSARLPASVKSVFGASMSVPPVAAWFEAVGKRRDPTRSGRSSSSADATMALPGGGHVAKLSCERTSEAFGARSG